MLKQRIYIENAGISGPDKTEPIICFDTGLDPRSFARTKMSQFMTESGYIVFPDGTHEEWKTAGVNEVNGLMKVWGPLFNAKRLDSILEKINPEDEPAANNSIDNAKQTALQAVIAWIKAKMFLGETKTTSNPGASFINNGKVFFAPEHISSRCLYAEGIKQDRYNNSDLCGMEEAAFCAGAMLYRILTGAHPFPSAEILQDMREGVFMPVHLAAPGLDQKLSNLIQSALMLPVTKNQTIKNGTEILTEMLKCLSNTTAVTSYDVASCDVTALYSRLPEEKKAQIQKEKQNYLIKHYYVTGTKRFAVRNRTILMAACISFLVLLFIILNMIDAASRRPTTAGLTSKEVVITYYEAFSELKHDVMEACIQGANKSDVNAAASYYAIDRMRKAYEFTAVPLFINPNELDNEDDTPAFNVFGITNQVIEFVSGNEDAGVISYRVNYILWTPGEDPINRSDLLMLKTDRRGNWRITEILRTER